MIDEEAEAMWDNGELMDELAKKHKISMMYHYKVIKSESPEMKVGFEFVTEKKLHDNRLKEKIVELSDVSCRDYWLKLLKIYTKQEWEKHKNKTKNEKITKNKEIALQI